MLRLHDWPNGAQPDVRARDRHHDLFVGDAQANPCHPEESTKRLRVTLRRTLVLFQFSPVRREDSDLTCRVLKYPMALTTTAI